jgi:hypothetical protein
VRGQQCPVTYVIGYSPFYESTGRGASCNKSQHDPDYDPVALAVLFAGLTMVGLFVFI